MEALDFSFFCCQIFISMGSLSTSNAILRNILLLLFLLLLKLICFFGIGRWKVELCNSWLLIAASEYFFDDLHSQFCFKIQVKTGDLYQSCCVIVKNMQRCVYAVPTRPLHRTEEMTSLERDVQESRISSADFFKKLQVSL